MIRALRPIGTSDVRKGEVNPTWVIDAEMREAAQIWKAVKVLCIGQKHRNRRELHHAAESDFSPAACLNTHCEVPEDRD